jgi:hypothetical protein
MEWLKAQLWRLLTFIDITKFLSEVHEAEGITCRLEGSIDENIRKLSSQTFCKTPFLPIPARIYGVVSKEKVVLSKAGSGMRFIGRFEELEGETLLTGLLESEPLYKLWMWPFFLFPNSIPVILFIAVLFGEPQKGDLFAVENPPLWFLVIPFFLMYLLSNGMLFLMRYIIRYHKRQRKKIVRHIEETFGEKAIVSTYINRSR